MGKAEFGTTKHLSNQMKAKGLQRLRFYCTPCQRQMRDDNAFKQHCMSESHVRNMLIVGEDPKKYIREYSDAFLKDFINLLKTGHRDKQVQINHFYQEYIANKEHVHMNSTQWSSLTEFAKHLGKEGICRVEENEKGIHISWIDDSPEALKRQEALRRKEAQDRGDEEREQRLLKEQIKRAQKDAAARAVGENGASTEQDQEDKGLRREEGDKIKLSIGAKPAASKPEPAPAEQPAAATADEETLATGEAKAAEATTETKPVLLKFGAKPAAKNVFASKKNAFSSGAKKVKIEQPKKISEAERIMREEMERKRSREFSGSGGPSKRQRM
ncbi:hypothetical protein PspLS_05757 [Pyricularia sp. CBS 133598]|nr:hypothetical protein PspLS_05757 [Pyricularia sp. CBS 133598]